MTSSSISTATDALTWHSLGVSPAELRCDVTLTNGQCFGWRKHPTLPQWTGVIDHTVLSLQQTASDTLFVIHHPPSLPPSSLLPVLRDYFFLDRCSLLSLYAEWNGDARFLAVSSRFEGLRLLRQDPLECLFSFICSSANNIPRITSMLATLRKHYGEHLVTLPLSSSAADGDCDAVAFHSFPSLERIAQIPALELRSHGFGYRADYFIDTALMLQAKGGVAYLHSLRAPTHTTDAVSAALMELPGVGPKVAACAALFSLDRLDLIPVDTHVHQIALRDYGRELSAEVRRSKGVTRKVHEEIAALFRGKFGPYAGWAHSVLFTAELPSFRHRFAPSADGAAEGAVVGSEKSAGDGGAKKAKAKRKALADKENVDEVENDDQRVRRSGRITDTAVITLSSTTDSASLISNTELATSSASTSTSTVRAESGVDALGEGKDSVALTALPFPVKKYGYARTIPKKAPPPHIRRMLPAVTV